MLFSIVCLCGFSLPIPPLKYLTLSLRAGHIILVGSATPPSIANPDQAYGLLFLAVIVMGIGGGAIKANVSPMIAEQYTGKLRKVTLPSGEDVLISPAVTIQRIYNWSAKLISRLM